VAIIAGSIPPMAVKTRLKTTGIMHPAMHVAAFCLGELVVCFSERSPRNWARFSPWLIAMAFGSELLEVRVYRISFEWYDLAADVTGILLGFGVLHLWKAIAIALVK
jgi:hypothetical protein